MRAIVQRCQHAECIIDDQVYSRIENGFVLLVGFTEGDDQDKILWMVNKILNLRVFPDEKGIMNLSLLDVHGEILSISQFTLYADCKKGNRPSYLKAMEGDKAIKLYDLFNQTLQEKVIVKTGVFGEHMDIHFTNCGPTTIYLEK